MDDFNMDGEIICRNPEQFGDGTAVHIRQSKVIAWCLKGQVPWLTRDELRHEIAEAINLWAAVCDINGSEVPEAEANLTITVVTMDGPGGVLADATLPSPSLPVQRLRIDIAEGALKRKIRAILAHEIGHILGLQHFPVGPPPELMEPALKDIETPQPTEAALTAKWYGLPKVEVPKPTPVPTGTLVCTMKATPTQDQFICEIAAEHGGRKVTLNGKKAWDK